MAKEQHVLVCYDITDDRARKQFAEELLDLGLARNQFPLEHVTERGDGTLLNENGRPLVADAVMEKLNGKRELCGTSTKLSRHIRNQAISLANTFLGEDEYTPFAPNRV